MILTDKITDEQTIKKLMTQVYDALKEKGYNPITQLVGWILTEDPTYITTMGNARSLVRNIDRDELIRILLEEYLSI